MEPKQKEYPAEEVTGDRSKVRCSKEQYCIGIWNVRSMNQGKLEMVKQEMARVNVDILGISELKWTGMGEFNSDNHYIYYCGQESLRRNGAPPRHAHGDLTSLAPHERLPEILVVPREKTPTGAAARGNPGDAPVLAS